MELQTGDNPSWDRSPVAFTETGVVSQFATTLLFSFSPLPPPLLLFYSSFFSRALTLLPFFISFQSFFSILRLAPSSSPLPFFPRYPRSVYSKPIVATKGRGIVPSSLDCHLFA